MWRWRCVSWHRSPHAASSVSPFAVFLAGCVTNSKDCSSQRLHFLVNLLKWGCCSRLPRVNLTQLCEFIPARRPLEQEYQGHSASHSISCRPPYSCYGALETTRDEQTKAARLRPAAPPPPEALPLPLSPSLGVVVRQREAGPLHFRYASASRLALAECLPPSPHPSPPGALRMRGGRSRCPERRCERGRQRLRGAEFAPLLSRPCGPGGGGGGMRREAEPRA